MEQTPTIRYEDIDVTHSVLKSDISTGELLSMLSEALNGLFPEQRDYSQQAQYRQYERTIEMFAEFLGNNPAVNPDEKMVADFVEYLRSRDEHRRDNYWKEFTSNLRCLINALPDTVRQRVILSPLQYKWATKWENLTPDTRNWLRQFRVYGRKTKRKRNEQIVFRASELTHQTKENSICAARLVMKALNISDLREFAVDSIEKLYLIYTGNRRMIALKHLNNMVPIYRYLLIKGFITKDPLADIETAPITRNKDWVDDDGVEKLADLSTVNMNDVIDVRDRMITYALCYDFGLRRTESSLLDDGDIVLQRITTPPYNFVHLHLRGKIQKGQGKADCDLFSLFPSTHTLVSRYLQLRSELHPRDNAFLISTWGTRLREPGVAIAVKNQCEKLGIKTMTGKSVSPHRLRHSLATLNSRSCGLALSREAMQDRMRHEKAEITEKTYTAVNKDIAFRRHLALFEQNANRVIQPLNRTSPPIQQQASDLTTITEEQAMEVLGGKGVTLLALRKTAKIDGALQNQGRKFLYQKNFIDDLCNQWTTKQEAMNVTQMTDKQYWHWTAGKKIPTKVIGKISLVRLSDVWTFLRERNAQKSA